MAKEEGNTEGASLSSGGGSLFFVFVLLNNVFGNIDFVFWVIYAKSTRLQALYKKGELDKWK